MGGWENRALSERQHCLIPLQGFIGALCVRARECMANGIFNNPWEEIHTRSHNHTQEKHRNVRVHWGWHFVSAPLFPPPGSPWHQRQQDSLSAGGNERSSWRKEEQETRGGGGRRSGGKGRRRMPRRAPLHDAHTDFSSVCGWNLNSLSLTSLIPSAGYDAITVCWFLLAALFLKNWWNFLPDNKSNKPYVWMS